MNAALAAQLLTLASSYDNRHVGEVQAKAWAVGLADQNFDDCVHAIHLWYRERRDWIAVSDIRQLAVSQANRRYESHHAAIEAPVQAEAGAEARRRLHELLERFARKVDEPSKHPKVTYDERLEALSRECPYCHQPPRSPCVNAALGRPSSRPHPARLEANTERASA